MNHFQYRAFGINILSTIELPELIPNVTDEPDVTISLGNVPEHLYSATVKGALYESSPEEILLKIENVASYYIAFGRSIVIQPKNNVGVQEIRLFLLGTALGAILHQRSIYPIHGSTLLHNNSGVIISGSSAVGKSSLIAGFISKGYKFLSDDVTAIFQQRDNRYFVHPGIPHIKLWKDVADYLGIKSNGLQMVRPMLNKYYKPYPENFVNIPVPLKLVIQLNIKHSNGFTLTLIQGVEKFNILRENTYRPQLVERLNHTESHFRMISALSQQIDVYRINRPSSPLQIKELVNFIEETILEKLEFQ